MGKELFDFWHWHSTPRCGCDLTVKKIAKTFVLGICLLLSFPFALLSIFGRLEAMFGMFAQAFSLVPGLVGDYMRAAYYFQTLDACSLQTRISFGSFFAQSA